MPNDITWTCSSWACHLVTDRYRSPPTALHNYAGWECYMYLQREPPLNIPHGRMYLWLYPITDLLISWEFRMQDWAPSMFTKDFYYLRTSLNYGSAFFRCDDDVWTELDTDPWVLTPNTWQQLRLSWRTTCLPDASQTLTVTLEHRLDGAWNTVLAFTDPLNKWQHATWNGVGFDIRNEFGWVDNFVIEELAAPPT